MLNQIHKTIAAFLCMFGLGSAVWADNAWGPYHWARATTSFDLIVVDSTTSEYVSQATWDWSESTVLNMTKEEGATSSKVRRKCKPPNGKVRICNLAYGQNGWLGLAGISLDTDGHIVSGYTKLNDSYFGWDFYNHPKWKQSVTCQELGHNAGLGHQDIDFDNTSLFSCMDYQDPPYEYPNSHDYEQLETIYEHTDVESDDGGESDNGCNAPPGKGCNKSGVRGNNDDIGWGMSLGRRGHSETFMRIDPKGIRHITRVLWVDDEEEHSQ